MSEPQKHWIPADWVDECHPKTGTNPNDFLREQPDETYRLELLETSDEINQSEREYFEIEVKANHTVLFMYRQDFGTITVQIKNNICVKVTDFLDPRVTHFFDYENIYFSLDEFAKQNEDGKFELITYFWSETIGFQAEDIGGLLNFMQVESTQ